MHSTLLGHSSWSLIRWPLGQLRCVTLIALGLLGALHYVEAAAQSCSVPLASSQPALIFQCFAGICEPNCPAGSPQAIMECGVANYNTNLSKFFGTLTYTGQIDQGSGAGQTIQFFFNS